MPDLRSWGRAPAEGSASPEPQADAADAEPASGLTCRAGRHGFREKLGASLRGLKLAVRGDSSFFAHTYRFLLIALTAALLGVGPLGWCLMLLGVALVFLAEVAHSAIDTLARAVGDPEQPGLRAAREIATAGVLVAVFTWAVVSITVLLLKLGDLLGWWARGSG